MIKKFAVKSKKTYEKNGEQRTLWLNVGTIIKFDNGSMLLELNMFPDKQFAVFEVNEEPASPKDEVPY